MEKLIDKIDDVDEVDDLSNIHRRIFRLFHCHGKMEKNKLEEYFDHDIESELRDLSYLIGDHINPDTTDMWLNEYGSKFYQKYHNHLSIQKRMLTEEEREEAMELLNDPNLIQRIIDDMDKSGVIGERDNKLLLFLIYLSTITNNPQHAIMTGDPSSGKSFVTNKIADYFEDKLIKYTRLTPKVLSYFEEPLDGRIMVVQEAAGMEETTDIRPMLSQDKGGLRLGSVKDGKKVEQTVKGVPSLVTTDVSLTIEEQFATRVWHISPNMGEKQTKLVLAYEKLLAKYPWVEKDSDKLFVDAISLLKPYKVLIPYSDLVEVPTSKVRARRDNKKLQQLIKLSALLHQYQRPKVNIHGEKYLIAGYDDLLVAEYAGDVALMRSYVELDQRLEEFYDFLIENGFKDAVTTSDVMEMQQKLPGNINSQTAVRSKLNLLVSKGLAIKEKNPDDGRGKIYYITNMNKDDFSFYRMENLDDEKAQEKMRNTVVKYLKHLELDNVEEKADKVAKKNIELPDENFEFSDIPGFNGEEENLKEILELKKEREKQAEENSKSFTKEELLEFVDKKGMEREEVVEIWTDRFEMNDEEAEEFIDQMLHNGDITETGPGIVAKV